MLCLEHCIERLRDKENWSERVWRLSQCGVGGEWSEKVTEDEVLERIGKKRTLLNNILRRKAYWRRHILRRNTLLHEAIGGQMTEAKGVGRGKRRSLMMRKRRY